ncbi:MAG: pyridoxal phosphate-dependent aminotransferase [Candidatus Heimdallarchaeota archaeon]|nr:pyridoxal phosphate-dependent aminotransferase [Candidatus Heimdallarchaeota archaeon]
MDYEKYLNSNVKNIPISGIRLVNNWPSKIPQSSQIKLNIGQPDLDTPEFIKEATIEALRFNQTRYTDSMGSLQVREAICEFLKRKQNLLYSPDEILVTAGGQSAIFASLKAILSPGDNVVIPFPSYPPYINAIKYNKAKIIPLKTVLADNFDIPLKQLKEILEYTQIKALLIISPGNPTGVLTSHKTQLELVKLASEFDFLLISDEIYNQIVYTAKSYQSLSQVNEARERTIIIQSFSKMLSMCGFRIGFIAAPKPLIDQIKVIHHTMNICASSIAQYAVYKTLTDPQKMDEAITMTCQTYRERKSQCVSYLEENPHIEVREPQGAFYLFPRVPNINMTDFAKWFKYQYGVLTVPGAYFSIPEFSEHNEYIRLCFTEKIELLRTGLQRFNEALGIFIRKESR